MPPKLKGHRLRIPLAIAGFALVGIGVIRFQPELEQNFKSWLTSIVGLLAFLLGLLWFLFLSRTPGRLRLAVLGVVALSAFALTQVLRVQGTVNGTGLPKLVWRWSAGAAAHLGAIPTSAGTNQPVAAVTLEHMANVPQFFGPNRDGIVQNGKLARDWSATPPKQLWRQPVGAGWSAFAVVDGRAYTQEQLGDNEGVTCYELLSGRLLWSHTNAVHFSQWQGGDGPRATPTVLAGRVFALGATGILDCLDAKSGQRVWSRDVLGENKLANLVWGVSASPLVLDESVIVTGGLTAGPTVLAYRRSDGAPLWRAGTDKASYASPIVAQVAGRRVVLSCNAASLTVHNPGTGEVLLNFPWSSDKWPKASQPVVLSDDRVFLSAGYGTGCVLLKLTASSDGKLSATPLWKNMRMKTQFNSVAARDGFLYGLDDGMLACVEIATGDRKWKDGRFGSGQSLLVDDLVLVQSEPGAVVLVEASPSAFRELGRIQALNGKTWNNPTLAGRYLLVRNSEEMACYEWPL